MYLVDSLKGTGYTVNSLKGLDVLGRFWAISYKGDCLFALMHTKSLLKKESTLKRKEFVPGARVGGGGGEFFSFRVDSFSEGRQINFERVVYTERVSIH